MFNILLWPLLAFAEPNIGEAVDGEIEVIAHSEIEVYVAPIIIKNEAPGIEAVIGDHSIFRYASMHKQYAVVPNEYGIMEPLSLSGMDIKVYNKDTIGYSWKECDYKSKPKFCSAEHSHYLLESYLTIDKNQIVLEMILYDPEMQIISSSSASSNIKITWIKQQEIKTNETTVGQVGSVPNQQPPCNNATSCPPRRSNSVSGTYTRNRTMHKPKEEMPLRWSIPPNLLDKHVYQCSIKLWTSTQFKD